MSLVSAFVGEGLAAAAVTARMRPLPSDRGSAMGSADDTHPHESNAASRPATMTRPPTDLARTHTRVPHDLGTAHTLAPHDTDVDTLRDTLSHPARTDPLAFPDLDSEQERRMEDLLAARLFPHQTAPQRIGRYTLLDRLGQGGMGVVYAAYDPELDRRVAIKLLNAPLGQAEARLLREAQAMARVVHANVVTVIEVGQHLGQTYVVMEYLRGISLERWPERRPDWRATLRIYIEAGRGLAAAHRAGVIHRDFKPHNVMLVEGGSDDGRVKVLDFGLARAAHTTPGPPSDAIPPSLTQPGAVMGTPAYMAPEQFTGAHVDERSDQFSFCVALHEALVGVLPFAGNSSLELMTAVCAGRLRPLPHNLAAPPQLLAIVARGLSTDPAARWPTMDPLLAALERVLHPRRLAPRTLALGLTAALLLGFGAAALTLEPTPVCEDLASRLDNVWDPARRAAVREALLATGKPYAAAIALQVDLSLARHADTWLAAARSNCRATRVDGDQSEAMLDLRSACLERRRADLTAVIDILIAGEHEPARALNLVEGLEPIEPCNDIDNLAAGMPLPPSRAARARLGALERRLARVRALRNGGRADQGLALARSSVDEARALEYTPTLAESLLLVSRLEADLGRSDDAATTLDAAAKSAAAAHRDDLLVEVWLAELWQRSLRGVSQETVDTLIRAAALALARAGDPPRLTALYHSVVAHAHQRLGASERALSHYDAALALIEHHQLGALLTLTTRHNRATLLRELGDDTRAETALRELLADVETQLAPQHPLVAAILAELALLAQRQDRLATALELFTRAGAIKAAERGPDHPSTLHTLASRAMLLHELGRLDEAAAALTDVLTRQRQRHGDRDTRVSETLVNLALVQQQQGALTAAEAALHEALAIDRSLQGDDHPTVGIDRLNLANILSVRGAPQLALQELEQARAILVAAEIPERDYLGELLTARAAAQTALGRHSEALATLHEARTHALDHPDPPPQELGLIDLAIGAEMLATGEREAGLARATEGLTRVLAGRAATHPQALTARANLAALLTRAGRADEAATRLTEILRDAETTHLDPHALAELRLTLADTLLATGDCDQARAAAAAAAAPLRADDPLRARAEALLSAQGPQRCR
jgi:serine/threonine protein kinase/tetratricopeptide (TPR) repeat protein